MTDSDSDNKSSNSNKSDILDTIIDILKQVEEEQKTIGNEMKIVKREVDKQINEQQQNFSNLLKDYEEKANEKINESINKMKDKILKNIKNSVSKEKKYKVKIYSETNNLELKKSLLENQKIKFTIYNIGDYAIPSGFYIKSINSNDENIELNHVINSDLEPNVNLDIETNFKIISLSDSSSKNYKTDLIVAHDKIKNINQEPFHFTIKFIKEDDVNDCPFTDEDYNYFDEEINKILECEKKKIKKILLSIYKSNKSKIKHKYKNDKENLFNQLSEHILSQLTE